MENITFVTLQDFPQDGNGTIDWDSTVRGSNNGTMEISYYDDDGDDNYYYIFDQPIVRGVLFSLYSTVFVSCFFGNLGVVLVTTLHWRMRNTATFCIANLAVANLCVAVFCVYQNLSLYLIESWIFGSFMCKMYFFVTSLSHTASVLILVVIAVERYVVIVHPFARRRFITKRKLQIVVLAVWIASAVICLHRFYSVSVTENSYPDGRTELICSPNVLLHNHKAVDLANFLLLFILPLIIISALYVRVALFLRQRSFHSTRLHVAVMMRTSDSSDNRVQTLETVLSHLSPQQARRRLAATATTTQLIPPCSPLSLRNNASGSHYCLHCEQVAASSVRGRGRDNRSKIILKTLPLEMNGNTMVGRVNEILSSGQTASPQVIQSPEQRSGHEGSTNSEANTEIENVISSNGGDNRVVEATTASVTTKRLDSSLRETHAIENRAEIIRLNFSRRRRLGAGTTGCDYNNSWYMCFKRVTTDSVYRHRTNPHHEAVIRMLIVIVITFALCNLPFHLRKLFQNYCPTCNWDYHPLFELATPFTFLSMYANCAINPFIYAFMHKKFRTCLKDLFSCRCRQTRQNYSY